jgi:2-aminobenzoate-CoA ligase
VVADSLHKDNFVEDRLPPLNLWPVFDLSTLPDLAQRPRLNIAAALIDDGLAASWGDRIAYLSEHGAWSYRRLAADVSRIGNLLRTDYDLRPGNRVLLRGWNSPLWVAFWLAVIRIGAIAVPTAPLLRQRELASILGKARPDLCLCEHTLCNELDAAMTRHGESVPVLTYDAAGNDDLAAAVAGHMPICPAWDSGADDICLIAFTSGTTGTAKATLHSHRNVSAVVRCFRDDILQPKADDVFCGTPSLAFAYGLAGLLLFPLSVGAATVLIARPGSEALATAIARHRATVCFTAPTGYRGLMHVAGGADLASLRRCVSAGEALGAGTVAQWREVAGAPLIDALGTTEMLGMFVSAAPGEAAPGVLGRAVRGYAITVLDIGDSPADIGVPGRLAVRGPTGCRYLDDETAQRTYVQRPWNITSDMVVRESDRYVRYLTRADDMIVSAGYTIAGPEVEAVLLEHPAVAECGVIGVPDPMRGQIVKAFVVLRPPAMPSEAMAAELKAFVRAHLALFKCPRAVSFLPALPRTPTGKLQRARLRELEA